MHVHFLDPYRPRQSLIHRLDARIKLVLALAFILTVGLTPPGAWAAYVLILAVVLSIVILSELGVGYVLKRASLALPFILAALPVLFTTPGEPLLSFSIGPWVLTVTLPGLERFLSIAIKSWISVQIAIVLAASTAFPDLLMAMRAVHFPRLLVSTFSLMWRYLFILADEVLRLTRARAARSGQTTLPNLKSGGSIAWRARVTGGMAGNLFLRAIERSDRVYMAMISRGYDGEARGFPLPALRLGHWLILALGLGLLTFLLSFSYLIGG